MISLINLFESKEKSKPWRNRSEVYILNKGKLVVGISTFEWKGYIIPGGGVDSGEDLKEAAKRETLEEIGVKVKDLKFLKQKKIKYDESYQNQTNPNALDKVKKYSGAIFNTFVGTFDGYDKKLWGKDIDSYEVTEITIKEAKDFYSKHALKCKEQGDKYNYDKALYAMEILNILEKL